MATVVALRGRLCIDSETGIVLLIIEPALVTIQHIIDQVLCHTMIAPSLSDGVLRVPAVSVSPIPEDRLVIIASDRAGSECILELCLGEGRIDLREPHSRPHAQRVSQFPPLFHIALVEEILRPEGAL